MKIPFIHRCVVTWHRLVLRCARARVLLFAIAAAIPVPAAWARSDSVIEEIVKGYRGSLLNSINAKRNSVGFTDEIFADDIGKLPSQNLADSLNRIPGVKIARDVTGEGQQISVRGLGPSFTKIVLNGNNISVASDGDLTGTNSNREVDLDIFPPELFSSLAVSKTPMARQLEGGTSGYVNFWTLRPFDMPDQHFRLSAEGAYTDINEEVSPVGGSGLTHAKREIDMTSNRKKTKKLPYYVGLASALISLNSVHALAQTEAETETSSSVAPFEEIIVTGHRQSIMSAQAIKRDAEQVVDSITAVDIGALPDRSLSEALQRVPGVQLERTNENSDPARLAAEGGGVFVRGLRWVRTELNGRDIFSASGGRTLGFEDVSADLMAGVDVYKTPTADQIEGGLGGTVNLRTRLPLEQDELLLAVSMDYNYADLYDKGFVSGSALYSDRWQLGNGEVGVLLSASIAEIGNRTDAIQTGRYDDQDDGGTEVYLPNGIGHRRVDWEQKRDSYNAAFQWAPSDELTFTLQTFYAEANPEDVERNLRINGPGGAGLAPWNGDYQYDANNALVSGVLNDSTLSLNTRFGSRESSISDYSLGFEYFPNERWAFSGDLQSIESEAQILSMSAFTQLAADAGGGFPETTFNFTGGDPFLSVSDQNRVAQADQYWYAAAMDHLEDNRAESLAGRLDAEYTLENNDFLKSFRFGTRVTDKDAITRQTGWNWSLLSNQYWLNNSPDNTAFLHDSAVGQSELYTFDDFMRSDIALPSVGWFPVESLLHSNTGALVHFEDIVANNGQGWGWSPLIPPEAYDLDPRGDNVSAGLNDQNEKTRAIYASMRFGGDIVDGNFGVRVVETETTALGRSVAGGISSTCDTSPSADCAGAQAFVDAYLAELGDFRSFTNSYTNVLPALNLRFKLQEDLQLRFGLSRGIVRPSFSQTRPSTTLSFDFEGNQFDPNTDVQGTVRTGSPGLEPTVADQFDTSIEWYFDDAGSLTFAAFYKDISDYVALVTQVEEFTFGGQTYEFDTTRQVNAESGKLKGFELAYQQFYDMLPSPFDGLGVQVNFTYIDNTGGVNSQNNPFGGSAVDPETQERIEALPIEGISDSSYNLVLMYEKYDISARLAYNWRERYLLTTNAANINRPMWFDDHGRLDGSLFYNVTDNLNIGLQISNILNSRTELEVQADNGQPAPYSWTDTDRRIAFVTRYRF